jgi:formylglycine-generating enzyme required for sulfatase activity
MGAPADDPTRAAISEDPVTVTLTHAFEIGQHEVTIAEWLDAGLPLSSPAKQPTGCLTPDCPAFATWYDAMRYANARSAAHSPPLPACYQLSGCASEAGADWICTSAVETGPLYDCKGYRIPTEAEWEYACRAGTTTAFYDGNISLALVPPGGPVIIASYDEPMLDPIAWYSSNSGGVAHPVGKKWPNPFCLYDILGNLSEWTSGGYDGQSYSTMYGSSPQTDPGATLGTYARRNDRGGAYFLWPAIETCFGRDGISVGVVSSATGVRLVRSL